MNRQRANLAVVLFTAAFAAACSPGVESESDVGVDDIDAAADVAPRSDCSQYETKTACERAGCPVARSVERSFIYADGDCRPASVSVLCDSAVDIGISDTVATYWRMRDDGTTLVVQMPETYTTLVEWEECPGTCFSSCNGTNM